MTSIKTHGIFSQIRRRVQEILQKENAGIEIKFDVFISYRQAESKLLAAEIYDNLKKGRHPISKKTLRVFFDETSIQPGQNINITLKEAILSSSCFIVILTETYSKTDYTKFEEMLITTTDWGGLREKILPILFEECEIPIKLQSIKYFDMRNLEPVHTAKTQEPIVNTIIEDYSILPRVDSRIFEWEYVNIPPFKTRCFIGEVLDVDEIGFSNDITREGEFLIYDTENVFKVDAEVKRAKLILNTSRILDATISGSGRYIVVSLGKTIIRMDTMPGSTIEFFRDLDNDLTWQKNHEEPLKNPNYWQYNPEFLYENIAICEAANLIAGSRKNSDPDGMGGWSCSEGFESIDFFNLKDGSFLFSHDCLDPGFLKFTQNGKYLFFGQMGRGVSCYDILRKRTIWNRWPDDNISLDDIAFLDEKFVLAKSNYWGFSTGVKLGIFRITNGNIMIADIDHLHWGQKTKDDEYITCASVYNNNVFICFFNERLKFTTIKLMTRKLNEIKEFIIKAKVTDFLILTNEVALLNCIESENKVFYKYSLKQEMNDMGNEFS